MPFYLYLGQYVGHRDGQPDSEGVGRGTDVWAVLREFVNFQFVGKHDYSHLVGNKAHEDKATKRVS